MTILLHLFVFVFLSKSTVFPLTVFLNWLGLGTVMPHYVEDGRNVIKEVWLGL